MLHFEEATRVPLSKHVPLPVVIRAPGASAEDLACLFAAERAELSRALLTSGAVLFRGFGVTNSNQLAALLDAAGVAPMRYLGGDSPRTNLSHAVYTSTEAPAAISIPLHNEMSYLSAYPRQLWMACAKPAKRGGATLIADGRAVMRALDPLVRARFVRHGVLYQCAFRGPGGALALVDRLFKASKSWMEAFETSDRELAAWRCKEAAGGHRWLPSGHLVLETLRAATVRHPETGQRSWFNQAHLFRLSRRYLGRLRYLLASAMFRDVATRAHHARFGDGSEIDAATLEHLYDVLDAHAVEVSWERGDVLWIDNLTCMHGRQSFGGDRRVMVAMTR